MAIIDDFKAINEACEKLSPSIVPKCSYCSGTGWVVFPDPRDGVAGKAEFCPQCKNRYNKPNPYRAVEVATAQPLPLKKAPRKHSSDLVEDDECF